MPILQEEYFGNSLQSWFIGAIIVVVAFFLLKTFHWIVVQRLSQFAKTTKTGVDDLFVDVVKRTHVLFFLLISLYLGLTALNFSTGVEQVARTIFILAILVQGGIWIGGAISFWLAGTIKKRMVEDAAGATTLTVLGFMARLLLWTIIVLVALDNMHVNITALVAGLGIGGIAVALALQNILGDMFSSLSIFLDKPFVIGDFIIVNDYMGTVEQIGLKTTKVRSLSGELIIFSNGDLLKSRLRNYKRMYERRVVFTIGVTYQTPFDKLSLVSKLLQEIIKAQDKVRFDRAHFKEYGESALTYEVVYYVLDPDYNLYMDIQQKINLEIYKRLAQEEIPFAYPTRTVHLEDSRHREGADPASPMKQFHSNQEN